MFEGIILSRAALVAFSNTAREWASKVRRL